MAACFERQQVERGDRRETPTIQTSHLTPLHPCKSSPIITAFRRGFHIKPAAISIGVCGSKKTLHAMNMHVYNTTPMNPISRHESIKSMRSSRYTNATTASDKKETETINRFFGRLVLVSYIQRLKRLESALSTTLSVIASYSLFKT